jgi:hypothetical protein
LVVFAHLQRRSQKVKKGSETGLRVLP